ncbi:MAG TPA: Ig-like domain-containing protein, partial [Pilimelia sp.]|nr:Ig-like domain-containing protein [Pilimelia sp.]
MTRTALRRVAAAAASLLVMTLGVVGGVSPSPASAAGGTRCGDAGTPSVVALHNSHFYIDSSSTALLLSGYAGYRVDAGASARNHLWLGFGGFTGGVLGLAADQPAVMPLPALASGASAAQYALLTATGPTTVPQSHTVTVYDGPPGVGATLCTRTFTYADVVDTIKALANKVHSVTSSAPATAQLGDLVTVTVEGNTGTLGAGPANDPGVLQYTPNALGAFPASAWRLERTELSISPDGSSPDRVTYVDRLFLTGASGPARPYTARYLFRAVGPSPAPTQVKPIQYIASGTQVKHTDAGGAALGALPAVSATAPLSLGKEVTAPADRVLPPGGGTASYALTVVNSGTTAGRVDWIADTLPTDAAFVSGSLRLNGRPVADPEVDGRSLVVRGPLSVPAAGQVVLSYSVQLGATAGTRVNSAVAHFGQVVLDSSADVTSSDPATAAVTVLGAGGLNLVGDAVGTVAGSPVAVDVLANDTTPSGLPLRVTAVGTPSSGTAVLGVDGTVTYTPATGTSGTRTFTYTATDGHATGTATVTVAVTPLAVRDSYSTGRNVTLSGSSVLTNDACTGCTVATTLVAGPTLNGSTSGTVTMAANGTFTYAPATNATGTVTFTYRATDAAGRSTDGQVFVDVADLAPDFATTPYGTAVVVPVQANDPGCTGNCKPQHGTHPTRGAVTYSSGNNVIVTYTPTTGLWGLDSFRYGITGNTNSATTPVTILVGPPATTLQTTYGVAATATVPTGGSCAGCVYSLGTPPAHGSVTVNAATGAATYAPAAGYAGLDSFTYQVYDPVSGLRVSGSVAVTVGPDAGDDEARVLLGNTVSGDVTGNDSCPATCTRTKLTDPASGSVVFNANGTYTYTPGTSVGTFTFTYRVTSSVSGSVADVATVRLTVDGAVDDTATTTPGVAVTVDVRDNDPCTGCTLTSVTAPASGTAETSAGAVRYTPAPGFSGQVGFRYTLSQAGGGTTSAQVTVTIQPLAVDDAVTTVEGAPVDVLPLANDLCANCALTGLGVPSSGSVERSDDLVTFTPSGTGRTTFTYTAADGAGNGLTGTVTVDVVAAPVLEPDTAVTDGGTPVVVPVLDNDSCPGCGVEVADDPTHGSVTVDVRGRVHYRAVAGFSGVDTFRYLARDPDTGAYATATVTVTVRPVAEDDAATTSVGTPTTVDVLANDDCRACVLSLGTISPGVTASISGGRVLVEPDTGWTGTATVRYTATDPSTNHAASATLTVEVSDARPDSATAAYGASVTGLDVLANDDCDGCVVTEVTEPSFGTAGFSGGTVSWTPPAGFAGLATFTYTAESDGHVVSSTVRILATPQVRHVNVDAGVATPVSTVSPATCPGCVVTIRSAAEHGDLDSDGTGGFTYTPPAGWTGTDAFDYRVTDPVSGRSVDSTVHLTVADSVPAPAVAVSSTPPVPGDTPAAGDVLAWAWTVTNAGNQPLTDLAVTSTVTGPVSCAADSLAVGAELLCSADHVLSQAEVDAGEVTANVDVSADSPAGAVDDADTATVPLARLPQATLAAVAALRGSGPPSTGDVIDLTYTATNTGNTTLSQIDVSLTDGPPLVCDTDTAAPGGTVTCTGTYAVTAGDLVAGVWTSAGTVTATSPGRIAPVTADAGTSTDL